MVSFYDYFKRLSLHDNPHDWQHDLAVEEECSNRLIRIPTGFGKTLGILSAWLWHRIHRKDDRWPRRLIWCLPMRVLVEQTEKEVRKALDSINCLWNDDPLSHEGKVGVHQLMGGSDSSDWQLYPEECAVLIGTQDMLLSRAMNRGYGAARARWPMEFGLLNHDALWVMDEVQLMDVGLATSAQLQAFRFDDTVAHRFKRPCHTWWMSATLQKDWLEKSPDTADMIKNLPQSTVIPEKGRKGHLWEKVHKPCSIAPIRDFKVLAELVAKEHFASNRDENGLTLVVLNTVKSALAVYEILVKDKSLKQTDIRLVHSRFRSAERAKWREDFLNKEACTLGTNRIIVATQVVEAGVDISSNILITELAPWASLVQRFGRCARWGGAAKVIVTDLAVGHAQESLEKARKAALPYSVEEIRASREALAHLIDVSPLHLEEFETHHPELLPRLYPYKPAYLLLRHELDELFDTTTDLSGADIDISRFIRSGDERDLQVFWADIDKKSGPEETLRPKREALCSVPFLSAREWLCGSKEANSKLLKRYSAWVWDWIEGRWREAVARDLYPGQTILVALGLGGYDEKKGWTGRSEDTDFKLIDLIAPKDSEMADSRQDDESQSTGVWQTIAFHGRETGSLLNRLSSVLIREYADIFDLAGRVHDIGKSYALFQGLTTGDDRPQRKDIAKAPKNAWIKKKIGGFRHELASVLALFAVLQRHEPDHPALLGPWREFLTAAGMAPNKVVPSDTEPTTIENEILALSADKFNLLLYLVCAHHGKVRVAWHACAADQEATDGMARIRGVQDGAVLPSMLLYQADDSLSMLPKSILDLSPSYAGLNNKTGQGWTERVLSLLDEHGPFCLAWLEAIMRAADQRASRATVDDPLLLKDNINHELETDDRELAGASTEGTAEAPSFENSPEGGPQHGIRGGACGPEDSGSRTHAPHHATRYLKTTLGILSYVELAPHLSIRVQNLEADVAEGSYGSRPIDARLILEFHHKICGDLVPDIAGKWRTVDVRVSDHDAPRFAEVPVLVGEYCRDLQARIAAQGGATNEQLLELLAFAEGRLLWIHPFADFNGRVTRVFLSELLQRLGLPAVDPTPEAGEETRCYLQALKAADHADWQPLIDIWRIRFEKEVIS